MENLNERIIQTAAECVEVLKDMEITNDSTSRSLFERKMKQYENQFYELEQKLRNQSRNLKKVPPNFQTINENNPDGFHDAFGRTNKFDGTDTRPHFQNVTYKPNPNLLEPKLFDSLRDLRGPGDVRANAKTYGDFKERPPFFGNAENFNPRPVSPEKNPNFGTMNQNLNQNYMNYPNEVFLKPIFPKTFLENYLSVSKNLVTKAPENYKYVLAKNIQNLGGIEDTIGKMEETLRQYELKNVYSYCELDDPKYQNYFMNNYNNFNSFSPKPTFRREFHEVDVNQGRNLI